MIARALQQRRRIGVARLAVERELEIPGEILVAGVHAGGIGQTRELAGEGFVEKPGLTAMMTVAGAGIEERVA